MKILLILVLMLTIFITVEKQSLLTNSSLAMANIARDMDNYSGDPSWVMRYNQAIWLSQSGQYLDAKTLLAPLINDTTLAQKSEIAELYGDLIYHSSGSIDDTLRMYERSLSFAPSDRIIDKIAYLQALQKKLSSSGTTEKYPKIDSGSLIREAKKLELQKLSTDRKNSLGTTSSDLSIKSELQRLIQSSGSSSITQDW